MVYFRSARVRLSAMRAVPLIPQKQTVESRPARYTPARYTYTSSTVTKVYSHRPPLSTVKRVYFIGENFRINYPFNVRTAQNCDVPQIGHSYSQF